LVISPDPQGETIPHGSRNTYLRGANLALGLLPDLLHVGNQFGDILRIHRRDQSALAKIALSLPGLGGQYMTCETLRSFDLAGTGLFEALGCAPVGLYLGHRPLLLSLF
jgi:hypothetical protein